MFYGGLAPACADDQNTPGRAIAAHFSTSNSRLFDLAYTVNKQSGNHAKTKFDKECHK